MQQKVDSVIGPQTDSGAEASLYPTVIGSASDADLPKVARPNELLDGPIYQEVATRERINMITSGSALASAPEERNAPKLMPAPSTQKAGVDVQRQDSVSFGGTGTNPLSSGASSASADDALKLTLSSSMRKIGQAMKRQGPVRFEDMGTDPFNSRLTSASEDDASELTPTPSPRKTETVAQRQCPVSFEDMGTNPLAPGASLASEDNALKLMSSSSMRKIGQAMKRQDPMRFEDMGTDPFNSWPTSASEDDASKVTSTPSPRKTRMAVQRQRLDDIETVKVSKTSEALSGSPSKSEQRSHKSTTAKGFPRPFPHTRITQVSRSAANHSRPARLQYTRTLAGITGTITKAYVGNAPTFPPTGLGEGVDNYLDAHGYDSSSRLHIMYAWRENSGIQDFIAYVCEKGMVESEARWLWQLIIEHY